MKKLPVIGSFIVPASLPDSRGVMIDTDDLVGDGKALIHFLPLIFEETAQSRLGELRDNMKFFRSTDTNVCVISMDAPETLASAKRSKNLPFPLLSDPGADAPARFGCTRQEEGDSTGVILPAIALLDRGGQLLYTDLGISGEKMPDLHSAMRFLAGYRQG